MSTDDLARRARAEVPTFALVSELADEVDRLRGERDEWAMQWRGADDMFGAMRDERDELRAERDAARAALGRVRAVHQSLPNSTSALHPEPLCSCDAIYPCETAQALEGES